jgi:hypothetical protein
MEARLARDLEELCAIDRPTCSPGEREAACWVARRLREAGAREVRVEEERAHPTFWRPVGVLAALGVLGGLVRFRWPSVLLGALGAAGMADEVGGGRRRLRDLLGHKTCWNVTAEVGEGERTLVVLAHHDAPRTGLVFDGRPQKAIYDRFPQVIERASTSVPMWWPTVGGPLLVALGALLRRPRLRALGTAMSAGTLGLMLDIERSPTVPGANDNGSGVVALIELARRLAADPPRGTRVVLVSAGAEESMQEGIGAWCRRHLRRLDPATTRVLNLETVGSSALVLLEGEGTLKMEDYDAGWRDELARIAGAEGIELGRGLRTRLSTDTLVFHRAGFAAATLASIEPWKAPANYHWPTDVPANVVLPTVEAAAALAEAAARQSERASATASSGVVTSPA